MPRAASSWPTSLARSKWRGTRMRNNSGKRRRRRGSISAKTASLPGVGAAYDEQLRVSIDADLAQQTRHVQAGTGLGLGGVEFHVADHAHGLGGESERGQAFGVARRASDGAEFGKDGPEHARKRR